MKKCASALLHVVVVALTNMEFMRSAPLKRYIRSYRPTVTKLTPSSKRKCSRISVLLESLACIQN